MVHKPFSHGNRTWYVAPPILRLLWSLYKVTVVCGSLDLVLSAVVSENYLAEISVVRVLRLVRIIRLLRLLKKNLSHNWHLVFSR